MMSNRRVLMAAVLLLTGGVLLGGCSKVSKDLLRRISEQELGELHLIEVEVTRVEKQARTVEEALEAVLPQARNVNISNLDAKVEHIHGWLKEGRAKMATLRADLETEENNARGLPRKKLSKDALEAHQGEFTNRLKQLQDAQQGAEEIIRKADDHVQNIGRGVSNIQQGLDEGGADADGE